MTGSDLQFVRWPVRCRREWRRRPRLSGPQLQAFAAAGDRLVALWGSDSHDAVGEGFVVHAAYAVHDGLACVRLPMSNESNEPPEYPALSTQYPAAVRMQRALFDLLGVRARNADDQRPWLRHAAWPADFFRFDVITTERPPSRNDRSTTRSSQLPVMACMRSRSGLSMPASSSPVTSASRSSVRRYCG